MIHLTKAEEQIMQKLWQLKMATVRAVLAEIPEPRPAYNTVSTIIRILEKKGMVAHHGAGKTFIYYALLKQNDYKKASLNKLISGYFDGSFSKMASFFSIEEELTTTEMEELQEILDKNKKK